MNESEDPDARVPLGCLVVFAVVFAISAVSPRYREDWLLEHGLTFIAVPLAIVGYRRGVRFSGRAYVQMTVFLVLHTIGAHYTYSEVPAGDWVKAAFDLSRNHYDRLVHFSFGVLMYRPMLELVARATAGAPRRATLVLAVACATTVSTSYELIEWATAAVVDPEAGTAFLGTQGDVWDAQKDTALAVTGALLAAVFELRSSRERGAPARPKAEPRQAASRP